MWNYDDSNRSGKMVESGWRDKIQPPQILLHTLCKYLWITLSRPIYCDRFLAHCRPYPHVCTANWNIENGGSLRRVSTTKSCQLNYSEWSVYMESIHNYVLPTEIQRMVVSYGEYPLLRPANWHYSDRSVLSSLLPTQYWHQKMWSKASNVLYRFFCNNNDNYTLLFLLIWFLIHQWLPKNILLDGKEKIPRTQNFRCFTYVRETLTV